MKNSSLLPSRFKWVHPVEAPDYQDLVDSLAEACWPEFMLHDPVADELWADLLERFSQYQVAVLDLETGRTAAMANSVPLNWDGDPGDLSDEGWDWALAQAVLDHRAGRPPRTQCALQIAIHPDFRSQGLSAAMLTAMGDMGRRNGLARLIAPVRPSQKSRYPITPMQNYIRWQTPSGLPFDAWLRVHVRVGGQLIRVCEKSMTIRGSVEEWQTWTGMLFPENGPYIVPGALCPVLFDLELNQGIYTEPNVWMVHSLE
jgi:GNAT superfamily N-acetyltransferase